MRSPGACVRVLGGLLVVLASDVTGARGMTSSDLARYFEPETLYIEFDAEPKQMREKLAQVGILSKRCTLPVESLKNSSDPGVSPLFEKLKRDKVLKQLRRLPQFEKKFDNWKKKWTLEPSFGCGILGSSSGRAKYWTLRFPAVPSDYLIMVREKLRGIQGVKHVAWVPKAKPPQSDEWVGDSSEVVQFTDTRADGQLVTSQWYLFACNVPAAWELAWPPADLSEAPIIAVVDHGFWTEHPELKDHLGLARNTCNDSEDVSWGDDTWHGTGSAGLLAAAHDGNGIMGVAYGAEVWPIQATCDANPTASEDEPASGDPWARAVRRVVEADTGDRRKIILLEVETAFGGNFESNIVLNDAIWDAVANNVVVVMTAGNGNRDASKDWEDDPIPQTDSILVGATSYPTKWLAAADPHLEVDEGTPGAIPSAVRYWKSNFGDRVVVSAPGHPEADVTLAIPDSDHPSRLYTSTFGGTSGAAPKVAGVVAMMLNVNPSLTAAQIKEILGSSDGSLVVGDDGNSAGRHLDALAAVNAAKALATPSPY